MVMMSSEPNPGTTPKASVGPASGQIPFSFLLWDDKNRKLYKTSKNKGFKYILNDSIFYDYIF